MTENMAYLYVNKSPLLLIESLKKNSISSFIYLIEDDYDLSFVDLEGNTIMHHIIGMNVPEEEIIKLLKYLERSTASKLLDDNIKNIEGYNCIDLAEKLEKKKIVEYLFLYKYKLSNAIKQDDTKLVKKILEYGGNINQYIGNSNYPLTMVNYKNTEMVKLLLEYKAEINVKNCCSQTPLYLAVSSNNIEIVKIFLEKYKVTTEMNSRIYYSPLHAAVRNNNEEMVKLLLKYGADINNIYHTRRFRDQTPLYFAVKNNNEEMVKLLLKYGAKVDLESVQIATKTMANLLREYMS